MKNTSVHLYRIAVAMIAICLVSAYSGTAIAITSTVASSITAPLDGATLHGTSYVITGTAFDNISGTVMQKVEVSTDGGSHWMTTTDTSGDGSWSTWSCVWPFAGDGTFTIKSRATDNASNVETPGAGVSVTLTRPSDTVWAWGNNAYGQLGDGTTTERHFPVQVMLSDGVTPLSGVDDVAAGRYWTGLYSHSAALKTDGTVWEWGYNGYGQLGDGTTANRYSPVQVMLTDGVTPLTGVVSVAAGDTDTVALKYDGTVWAWGNNGYGRLGDGTTANRYSPVQVSSLTDVVAIACVSEHTVALRSDGTVWAWGYNGNGELGDGTTNNSSTPVQVMLPDGVTPLTGVVAVACGAYFTAALKSDGTVWTWGSSWYGSTGATVSPVQVMLSDEVTPLTGAASIAAANSDTAALMSDGTVWGWGRNDSGQVGDGTTTYRPWAVQMAGLTGVTAIADEDEYAIKSDGTVWTWGNNVYGQLGIYTADANPHPFPVQLTGLADVDGIASGAVHTLALGGTYTPALSSSVTDPARGAALSGASYTITGTAFENISGGSVSTVEVSTDGGTNWSTATDTSGSGSWSTWSYDWTLPSVGDYCLLSRATDNAANVEVPGACVSVTVDHTAPTSSISSPTAGATLSGTSFTISGTADDGTGSGVQKVAVSTDGGGSWSFANYSSGTWSYWWSCSVKGAYTIMSNAMDFAGNVETPGPGVSVTVSNHAPSVSSITPSTGIYSDEMLDLFATASDSDPADSVVQVEYGYSTDGGTTWASAGIDNTPEDPFHWNSGLGYDEVYLRARAYDGIDWGGWYYNAGPIQVDNTDPVIKGPVSGTSRGADYNDLSVPLVLDWYPNNCTKFTVFFSAEPFGKKAVKLRSGNKGLDPTLHIPFKNWLTITRLGREIWWWVIGTAPDGTVLTSAANLLVLNGGFSALTDIPTTDVRSIPTFECDPGVNVVTGLQFSQEPYFNRPVKYPKQPEPVVADLYSSTPDTKTWSNISRLNRDIYWRFTGRLATGETTYSQTMMATVTGGPSIDSLSDGELVTSAPTITWTDGGGFVSYKVQASASSTFQEKKPVILGSTKGEKTLTVGATAWDNLKSLGNEVYIRVVGNTDEKYTAYGPPVRILLVAP